VQAPGLGLIERLGEDLGGDTADLVLPRLEHT
jgi:hypothetical protein